MMSSVIAWILGDGEHAGFSEGDVRRIARGRRPGSDGSSSRGGPDHHDARPPVSALGASP